MESKRISLIIPVYKTSKYLDRCLRSLVNQDWDNKEIICIFDGEDKEAEKIIKEIIKFFPKENIAYKVIEHGGACRARNEGAKLAKGDVYSFFNSDYVAVPGMIRTWMEALEDFPDYGFVYGGYGWIDPQKDSLKGEYAGFYASEEFNPFTLENYNYIDCASPIRKEIFRSWDNNCKSLQDWDFFLRIVKSGVKGKFIKDILYAAELPRPEGLSDDSARNWIERVRYVKKNHNIKEHDIVITSIGAPLHAINVAKMLEADFKGNSVPVNFKPHNYKMIYLIGCYCGKEKNFSNLSVFRGSAKDCIKIIHWVGADIYWLRNLTFEEVKFLMPKMQAEIHHHFVECEQTQKEMLDYGLKTEIVPIPPPGKYEILPLPKEFTVAVMKTEKSDFDKYCGNLMDEVMAALPNIKFKVFGDGKCKRKLENVENMGYVKMPDLIEKSSCFLRIVRHDGMMMAANEFVMCGRDAITNLEMPYMDFVDTQVNPVNWDRFGGGFSELSYPETKAKIIEKILEVKRRPTDARNRIIAHNYYKNLLDPKRFKDKIYGLLKNHG